MPLSFRELSANTVVHHCIRVLIAMIGVVIFCRFIEPNHFINTLFLGVLASAIAQTDDNVSSRFSALILTLICFTLTTFSVEILFNTPLIFAFGFMLAAFSFTLLGAISSRYATIAFASLLISVYTMIGANASVNWWTQPLYLLAGATWYGLVSLVWIAIFPTQPVQQRLIQLFYALGNYFEHKSTLFHPSIYQTEEALRLLDVSANVKVVDSLNLTKLTILNHIRGKRLHHTSLQYLKIYHLAQDIHERANSSHCRYDALTQAFFHSDIMFRIQHLLRLQARTCKETADTLFTQITPSNNTENAQAHQDLYQSLTYLKEKKTPENQFFLPQLEYLANNLATIEQELSNVQDPLKASDLIDKDDFDPHGYTLREKWRRFCSKISPRSLLFRHAVRLSLALTLGYGLLNWFELQNGYWILLTILFVCQPNYSATRNKLIQRILGTLIGLVCGIPLLTLFPDPISQQALMILFGVLFFAFRAAKYMVATTFITLLVLISFNQQGSGFDVMLPRLFDTLIGCLISVFAVRFILPDWQAHRLRSIMLEAILANKDYLALIISQYHFGKKDDVFYRNARQKAHKNDAQLSSAITNMLAEPGRYQVAIEESFRFLCLNHSILNFVSALGANRTQITDDKISQFVTQTHQDIHQRLEYMVDILSGNTDAKAPDAYSSNDEQLAFWRKTTHAEAQMVLQQLNLIQGIMQEMQTLTEQIATIALQKKRL